MTTQLAKTRLIPLANGVLITAVKLTEIFIAQKT